MAFMQIKYPWNEKVTYNLTFYLLVITAYRFPLLQIDPIQLGSFFFVPLSRPHLQISAEHTGPEQNHETGRHLRIREDTVIINLSVVRYKIKRIKEI